MRGRIIPLVTLLVICGCTEGQSADPYAPQLSKEASVPRALTNGSVEFYGVQGQTVVAWEKYEFNAVRSGPGLEARGHVAWNVRRFDGENSFGRADVGCAAVDGNTAWIAGPITSLVIEGVTYIPGAVPRWMMMRVRDMGEGVGSVDVASILVFVGFNNVPLWCEAKLGPPPSPGIGPEYPIVRGNVTVHSR